MELKDRADVEFALEQFEALWADAVDISADYNAEGKVVGIEVLYISQCSPKSWQQILLETTA